MERLQEPVAGSVASLLRSSSESSFRSPGGPGQWQWSDGLAGSRGLVPGSQDAAPPFGESASTFEGCPAAMVIAPPRIIYGEQSPSTGVAPALATSFSASALSLTPPRSRPNVSGQTTPTRGAHLPGNVSPGTYSRNVENGGGNSVLSIVKREMEYMESRLLKEVNRVRETIAASAEKTDRLRDVALQRLEQKNLDHEATQSKLDRKLSELSGAMRGLSDETQMQIRRADTVDARLWEFRHQLEEDLRAKSADLESQIQEMLSKCRVQMAAGEDGQKRVTQNMRRLETAIQERFVQSDMVHQAVGGMHDRLESLEDARSRDVGYGGAFAVQDGVASREVAELSDVKVKYLEQQIAEAVQKIERIWGQAHGDDGWDARLEEHEVRISGIRSKLDSQEEHYASFDDRIRQEWETKFDQLRKCLQENVNQHYQSHERLEALHRRTDGIDQSLDDMRHDQSNAAAYGMIQSPPAAPQRFQDDPTFGRADRPATPREYTEPKGGGIQDARSSGGEVNANSDLVPHISALVSQLKDIAPKVIEHDRSIKELRSQQLRMVEDLAKDVVDTVEEGSLSPRSRAATVDVGSFNAEVTELRDTFKSVWVSLRTDVANLREQVASLEASSRRSDMDAKRLEDVSTRVMLSEGRIDTMSRQLQPLQASTSPAARTPPVVSPRGAEPCGSDLARGIEVAKPYVRPLQAAGSEEEQPVVVEQELSSLFQRVEESETECSKLQQQLKGRIFTMDKLLEKVASEVLVPSSDTGRGLGSPGTQYPTEPIGNSLGSLATQFPMEPIGRSLGSPGMQFQFGMGISPVPDAIQVAADTVLQALPRHLPRICVLGSSEFHSSGSKRLVEMLARKIGSELGGRVQVLTGGLPGVQDTFVKSLGSSTSVVNVVPESLEKKMTAYEFVRELKVGATTDEWMDIFGLLGDIYVTIEGGPGVAREARGAFARGAAVLPFSFTGGASAGQFDFPAGALQKQVFASDRQWEQLTRGEPEKAVETAVNIMRNIIPGLFPFGAKH